jgi:hypothetical protein
MNEIIFLVEPDIESGYIAQALGESIITQADDLESLKEEIKDAVHCHFPNEAQIMITSIMLYQDTMMQDAVMRNLEYEN